MSTALQFDEEAARRVEAIYSTPDVVVQRQAVLQALALRPGERVLDIGCGPGFLAAEMAEQVALSGSVCGIDISESMLAIARARCSGQPTAASVSFQPGDAAQLPFPAEHFDAVVSTQVLEYVPDLPAALAAVHRVLRPGGRALLLDTDWDSLVWHATDRPRMERILAAWNDHCADPFLPRTLAQQLARAGLRVQQREIIPLFNPVFDPNTYSYGVIGIIETFVPGHHGVTPEEAAAWAADLRSAGATGDYFFSLNRYLFLAVKPEAA